MTGRWGRNKAPQGPRAEGMFSYLFEVVQAMLVTVGDMQGIEVLQRAPLIWKAHGGDSLQDLVQLLLAGGLWAQMDTDRHRGCLENEFTKHWPWEPAQKARAREGASPRPHR